MKNKSNLSQKVKSEKILKRFLKEIGLLNSWRRYIKKHNLNFLGTCVFTCSKEPILDTSFGYTEFSRFVNDECHSNGIRPFFYRTPTQFITEIFKHYLLMNYGNKIRIGNKVRSTNVKNSGFNIDTFTHRIERII